MTETSQEADAVTRRQQQEHAERFKANAAAAGTNVRGLVGDDSDAEVAQTIAETEEPLAGVVRIGDVDRVEVEWVWHPYIPRGKLTLLEGDPGQGKSWITLAIATALSLGHGLPGEDKSRSPGRVLIMTAEDGLGDTVRPRLDDMGADVDRIYASETVDSFDDEGLEVLAHRARVLRPDLIIVDPLVAYIGARVDIHRANETREVLSRLASIAEQTPSAILAVRHLNKGSGGKAIYRGLGSIDFTATVRSVLLVGQDPEDTTNGAVVHIKSNLAPTGESLGYRLSPQDGFAWTGPSSITADELLGTSSDASGNVDEFLLAELAEPRRSTEILAAGLEQGFSRRTLQRAKKRLNVTAERVGFGGDAYWQWKLP